MIEKMTSNRMLKIILAIFITAIIILVGIFVFQKVTSIKTETQEKHVLLPKTAYIGWIGPLTGSANIIGVDNLNSVKLALSEYETKRTVNEPHIKLAVADDKNDAEMATKEYKKMVASVKPAAMPGTLPFP